MNGDGVEQPTPIQPKPPPREQGSVLTARMEKELPGRGSVISAMVKAEMEKDAKENFVEAPNSSGEGVSGAASMDFTNPTGELAMQAAENFADQPREDKADSSLAKVEEATEIVADVVVEEATDAMAGSSGEVKVEDAIKLTSTYPPFPPSNITAPICVISRSGDST